MNERRSTGPARSCRVGITPDVLGQDGGPLFEPAVLQLLDGPGLAHAYLPRPDAISRADLEECDVICAGAPGLAPDALASGRLRTRLIARFGVGYDHLDVAALTRAGILLTINPDGVRRPLAIAELSLVLALAHRLVERDRLVRQAAWERRLDIMGSGLAGKTLASIGLGNIGRELFRVAAPFAMRQIACDPHVQTDVAASLGVSLVSFETALREADFLVVNCPLDSSTRHLVGAGELKLMKPGAFLVNCARGAIVDEAALAAALSAGAIAGAGLDVFESEPPQRDNPLFGLPNVILSPHSLAYSDETWRLLAEGAFRSAACFARGEVPPHLVNPAALDHPSSRAWFAAQADS
jgi:phosphoglycerate dehydrogenase-like enzyme